MRAYFMRHGQTNYNIQALCNADPHVDVHLTKTGIKQAQEAAEKLSSVPLQRIFVSELPRTYQTAQIVNAYHNIEIITHSNLNDIDSGFEGKPVAEYFAAVGDCRLYKSVNGGESVLDYKERLLPFLQWLDNLDYSNVLVIAHEETLRIVNAYYRGLDDEAMMKRVFKNCEFIAFDVEKRVEILRSK